LGSYYTQFKEFHSFFKTIFLSAGKQNNPFAFAFGNEAHFCQSHGALKKIVRRELRGAREHEGIYLDEIISPYLFSELTITNCDSQWKMNEMHEMETTRE
jgi:hypothetical protein